MDYTHGTWSKLCKIDNIYNIQTNVFNYKLLQRLYYFKNTISLNAPQNWVSDLCSNPCRYDTVCSLNEYYYDIVY